MTDEGSRAAILSLALVSWLLAGNASAQTARATVTSTDCPVELGAAVETALDVELSIAGPEVRQGLDDGTLRCALVCDASGTTAIVFQVTERVEQRIEGGGPGLARRLAIALAELLEASSAPLPEPQPEPLPPRPQPGPSERFVTRVRVAGGAWLGGAPLLALGAFELGVELAPTSNVALVLGAGGALGAIDVEGARLDVRLVSGSVSLRLGAQIGPFWLGGGPAVRGGAVLWSGTPEDAARAVGSSTTGGWLGVGAVAVAFVRIDGAPLRIGLEVEGGGIAFHSGALVLGALAAQVGGGWIEPRLAVDLSFD